MLTPAGFYALQLRDIKGVPQPAPVLARQAMGLVTSTTNWRQRMEGNRELVTKTFNTAGTHEWMAPYTTLALEALSGKGEDGQPYVEGGYWWFLTITTTDLNTNTKTYSYSSGDGYAPGDDYCEGYMDSSGKNYQRCYDYTQYYNQPQAETTGASASAFGKTFPGGIGGQASAYPINASTVTIYPGVVYKITVPSGGYITFQYYQ